MSTPVEQAAAASGVSAVNPSAPTKEEVTAMLDGKMQWPTLEQAKRCAHGRLREGKTKDSHKEPGKVFLKCPEEDPDCPKKWMWDTNSVEEILENVQNEYCRRKRQLNRAKEEAEKLAKKSPAADAASAETVALRAQLAAMQQMQALMMSQASGSLQQISAAQAAGNVIARE